MVLDLRAGLDANVIDFLPLSNSGVLVFTPHHPAATLAAGDIVKSLLFRKLRFIFAEESPFYVHLGDRKLYRVVNELLDQVEDVYEDRLPNLDAFLEDLLASLGANPYLNIIAEVVHSFGVYFVLNMFSGVRGVLREGHPPVRRVPHRLRLLTAAPDQPRLGRPGRDDPPGELRAPPDPAPAHAGAPGASRRPRDGGAGPARDVDPRAAGARPGRPTKARWEDEIARIDGGFPIERQLEILNRMYHTTGQMHVRDNFAYIAHRSLHVVRNLAADRFGHPRLFTPLELFGELFPDLSG